MHYHAFHELINAKGTNWDRAAQFVHAASCLWVSIFEINPFAAAYYCHDEPENNRLRALFTGCGDNVVQILDAIQISSSSGEMFSNDSDYMDLAVDEDAINSSAVVPKAPVCRKLKFRDGTPADMASTAESAFVPFHFVGSSRHVQPQGHHRTDVARFQTLQFSPLGSSLASNSPIGVWRQVRK